MNNPKKVALSGAFVSLLPQALVATVKNPLLLLPKTKRKLP